MRHVVVATGTGFGEGPVWRSEQGDLLVTSVSDGCIFRVDVGTGQVERFADTAGGPNGAVLAADGGLVVANNGGEDLSSFWPHPAPPVRRITPGLQLVGPDGSVRFVDSDYEFVAPNDIAVDTDGSIVFSDMIHNDDFTAFSGRIYRYGTDGSMTRLEELPHYLNGVGAAPGGLLTAEATGLRWVRPGDRSWLSPDCGQVDGFAADADGRVYACLPRTGIVVVDPDGTVVDHLEGDDDALLTNCCFGGPDLRTLFVSDSGNATVVAFEGMPTPGHPLVPFRAD